TSEDYSDTAETGVIIAQNPQPDREKVMPTDGGRIAVELTVSLGPRPAVKMPDLVNKDFWTAQSILEDYKLDLDVQTESVVSDEVTENYVIRTVPEAGAALVKGKTVSIFYSAGPERKTTTVPNVVGRTESAAKLMLEDRRLTPDIKHVDDNAEEGTVFFQSEPEGKTVDEHAVITIHVSNGPPPTPTPSEEPSPSPTEEPSPEPSPTPDFPPDDVWGVQGDPPPTTGSEPQI
ncbi:MAG: PASTA domain-containing protein, partial [Oscillospiraceae bacterium]|nr:PASTA domain-containing protein [Oscillospiraceae bacterium]